MSAIIPTVDIVSRPQAHGYDGQIDNILIRLAVSPETPLEDATAEAAAPRIDTSEGAEDMRDEVGRRYSRSDLSGGAGLDFLHTPNRPQDAPIRFWDSKGVDVFSAEKGEIYDASLMHTIEEEGSAWTDIIDIAAIDSTVYYIRTTDIYEYPIAGSKATVSGVTKMVALGNSLYTIDGTNGVHRYDPPTWTPAVVSAKLYDNIWPAKGRILGALDNELFDADSDTTAILTLPPNDYVTHVLDVGSVLLAFATTGDVHAFTLDNNSALVSAGMTRFVNEIPLMAAEVFGVVGLVTAATNDNGGAIARFYTAVLDETTGVLAEIQLIFQRGDRDTTVDLSPHAMTSTRDSIFVAITEEGATEITLWRYYLPTGGYARAHSIEPGVARTISSFVEVDDRMWVAIPSDDMWVETDDYAVSGYVIGPLVDFYTSDDKQWVSAEITAEGLPVGNALELYHTNDPELINDETSADWQLVATLVSGDSEKGTNTLSLESRYHAAKIVLRSPATRISTPRFRSFSFRALPNPVRDTLLRIPINVSDQIESPGRRAVIVNGRGKAIEQTLRAYEGAQVLIELYRPEIRVQGLIERFESTIEIIAPRGSVRRVMYARIRGSHIFTYGTSGASTSGSSLGQDTLGLVTLGKGEATT